MVTNSFVIAIDGLSASGKGTLGANLANYYGCKYLPTGNLYRLLALRIINHKMPLDELESSKEQIQDLLNTANYNLLYTDKLNRLEIADVASKIAKLDFIREMLNEIQYSWIENNKIAILEGRDIGTVICPKADVKIYMTASDDARAKRRFAQLQEQGKENISLEEIVHELRQRDKRDLERKNSPLKKAADAYVINSSYLTSDEVFQKAVQIINKKIKSVSL